MLRHGMCCDAGAHGAAAAGERAGPGLCCLPPAAAAPTALLHRHHPGTTRKRYAHPFENPKREVSELHGIAYSVHHEHKRALSVYDFVETAQPEELNLLEDGLQLWLVALRNAPGPQPALLEPLPHLVAIMDRSTGCSCPDSEHECKCQHWHMPT